ncbi:TIGR04222 domain-containing membrane protein [Burkholderia sp. Tr-862]|uniref:TIGR04222 domain-containing membrane protein n=1 Tax=Burkholderia sp. Tr-862 TaxID=2608331 RepID=UPI00141A44B0|nr:TIGR04222 domain-containing membrane protein [Burkholderia sp. Tr-862]NIF44313.1 TIGR04222 domain-containing membrane protein [Burkholderia sp. Tr-862]
MAAIPSLPSAGDARALTDAQQALLTRLLAYSPDDPHAALPYSRRLAEAEGWTHAHALAVIDEYKRFAFLAQAAGHPVTPSVAVDAAWHFHLQYTLEYWDVFCAGVLRARLHHMPGTGAPDEAAVYARRYQNTLDSYRRLFGCEPPASIWPRPDSRPTDAGSPQAKAKAAAGTDRPAEPTSAAGPAGRRSWRDRLPKAVVPAAAASVIATAASARDFDVLNYTGPQFLAFYLPVCIVALLLIVVLQQIEYRCRRRRAQAFSSGLTAEKAACLMGDESRAVQVATLSLVQAGAIDLSMAGRLGARVRSVDPTRGGAYADECAWLAALPDGEASFGAFRQLLARRVSDYANALRGRGRDWLWKAGEMRAARMASRAIALAVLGTGAAKLAVGLSRGRPVLLLVISMAVFAIAYRIVTRRLTGFGRGGLTVGGRTAVAAHQRACRDEPDSPDAALWATALFGAGALAGTAWAAHSMALMEPPPVPPMAARGGGSSGSTYSSNDSSSNCSSSSSCSSSSCSSSSCGGCSSSS